MGGVYATFSYHYDVVNPVTSESDGNNTIEDKFTTDEGTITITKNDLAVSVKNKGNNVTTLDKLTGEVKATFNPSSNASEDTKTNGIYWNIRIDFKNNTYDGKDILTTNTWGSTLVDGENVPYQNTWLHYITRSKELTLSENDEDNQSYFNSLISVTEFTLSTETDYVNYVKALKNVKIAVTLGRYVPTLPPTK